MMILGFLSERAMCGYELRKKMEQLQGDMRRFSDGSVYPATARLVKAGLISERTEMRDGRQRHLFTLETAGRERLIAELRGCDGLMVSDFNRWRIVLTFLSIVPDKDDRDAVLRRRYDLLNGKDVHFFYCEAGNPLTLDHIGDPYRRGLLKVNDAAVAAELGWLGSMLDLAD
ncbi:PadR family transcriptional regulator [Bifidobacterium leontopitheci]|uniref:PadR family transcriptional regulator n=2 Tax=Bifidobacterium leontopitheci TaxID=2650774 RepID=A0A6I1GGI4_9BIFI|nr:PadR family transcriptional regulator [Bifidobacterium leontopitheci]